MNGMLKGKPENIVNEMLKELLTGSLKNVARGSVWCKCELIVEFGFLMES